MAYTIDDAVGFARCVDGAAIAMAVVDWSGVRDYLDRNDLWNAARFDAWLAATPDPQVPIAPLLRVRYATPAALLLFDAADLASFDDQFQRALRSLDGQGVAAIREFQSGSIFTGAESTATLEALLVRGSRLHRPTRSEPFAITLLRSEETRAAARRLRHSEARYEAIVKDQTDFIVRYLPDGVRTFVNRPYAEFFGGETEDYLGTTFLAQVADEYRAEVQEKIRRLAAREAEVLEDEHESIRHDGVRRWTQWVDRGLFDEDGKLIELQAVGRDITERKEAESQRLLLEQRLAQAQKMEAIGTLAGGLAHDFNNSLMSIFGYSDLIRAGSADRPRLFEYAEAIREAAERSSELTRSLLHLSRRSPLRFARCDVVTVVESGAKLLRASVPARIELKVVTEKIPPVLADAGQLTQAILNLGLNARDAIAGHGSIEIRAVSRPEEGHAGIVLSVKDDGAGIPEHVRAHLFEPFFTTKPAGRGTGLGLAMVYAYVVAHRGRVEVSTEPGVGTTLELHLPLAISADGDDSPKAPATLRGNETILLVDDEPMILLQCRQSLEAKGYRVLTASSGQEAIERFGDLAAEIGAIVTDLVMPGGNGRVVEQQFHARRATLPVLLMTGGFLDGETRGFVAVLQKPFPPNELVSAVRTALDRN